MDIRLATCGVALLLAGGCASTASAPTTTPLPSASADPWVALEARPLALPTVAPGDCPTAAGRQVNPGFGDALGDGPVYPVGLGTDGVLHIGSFHDGTDWLGEKVLWVASPDFTGHAIVRGARIDSAGEMTFDGDGQPPRYEMRFEPANGRAVRPVGSEGADWYNWATHTLMKVPGCYAYRVDGDAFSYTMSFARCC